MRLLSWVGFLALCGSLLLGVGCGKDDDSGGTSNGEGNGGTDTGDAVGDASSTAEIGAADDLASALYDDYSALVANANDELSVEIAGHSQLDLSDAEAAKSRINEVIDAQDVILPYVLGLSKNENAEAWLHGHLTSRDDILGEVIPPTELERFMSNIDEGAGASALQLGRKIDEEG